jgi:hypothetical protein
MGYNRPRGARARIARDHESGKWFRGGEQLFLLSVVAEALRKTPPGH